MNVISSLALREFRQIALEHLGGDRAVIIYGSQARSENNLTSDLDVLFIGNGDRGDLEKLTEYVIAFSKSHRLPIDDEVPFWNKLLATRDELLTAASCRVFDEGLKPIPSCATYAGSPQMRERLLINILTSPNIAWEENAGKLSAIRRMAIANLVSAARRHLEGRQIGSRDADIVEALFRDGSIEYKHWIGYKDDRLTRDHLLRLMRGLA